MKNNFNFEIYFFISLHDEKELYEFRKKKNSREFLLSKKLNSSSKFRKQDTFYSK